MTETKWQEDRRRGIGGSDVAAILGLSPWKSAMDVWLDKLNLTPMQVTDPAQQFILDLGHELEPVIANCYTRQTGRELFQPYTFTHPDFPVLRGNPDRITVTDPRGVELKSETQFSDKFGEPGTDQVPAHYLLQCAHYMAITNLPVWDVALLRGGSSFSIYTIHRDKDLEAHLITQLIEWWDRHIVQKVPPDIDGSGAWKAYLARKFPRDILPIRMAEQESLQLISNLIQARRIVDQYTGVEYEMQNRVKFLIGEHEGIEGDFGKITWKRSKDSKRVDWESAFQFLASATEVSEKQVTAILAAHTDPVPGTRRFLVKEKEGWTYGDRNAIDKTGLPDDAHTLSLGDREGTAEASERGSDDADRPDKLPA